MSSPLVLIPSYNSGTRLVTTVREALRTGYPVWVVVDGSTDQSFGPVLALTPSEPNLKVLFRESNGGKGAAVLTGARAALQAGFTHALVMDSDGQHPVDHIESFMQASRGHPTALILGAPVFGPEVPKERLHGRKLSVGLVKFETWGGGIDDPLFGFRVYPLASFVAVMQRMTFGRGFDFDPEVAVKLFWAGVPTINLPAPCRYLSKADGGISHFRYLRDNVKMIWLHTRLIVQFLLLRWPDARRAHGVWRQSCVSAS